jgi:prophage tail gpP-like protein
MGWSSWSIESDLVTPSDAFRVEAPNVAGKLAGKFHEGQDIEVLIDGEKQLVGIIDDVIYRTTNEGARIELVGRDSFCDLVDCSATPKTYTSTDLLALAKALSPSWLTGWVKTSGVTLGKRTVKIDPGDSKMDVLQREAKKDVVILWLTHDGIPTIGKPDYTTSPVHRLRLWLPSSGMTSQNNIESCEVTRSMRDRFSKITVYGHGSNSSAVYGKQARHKQSATDADLDITRELILSDGDAKTIALAKIRAQREVADRTFGAFTVEATVRGHYGTDPDSGDSNGLYQIDQQVDFIDEASDTRGRLWISKRRFEGDENGQVTNLSLRVPKVWLT